MIIKSGDYLKRFKDKREYKVWKDDGDVVDLISNEMKHVFVSKENLDDQFEKIIKR